MKINSVYKDISEDSKDIYRLVKKGFNYQIYVKNESSYVFMYKGGCVETLHYDLYSRNMIKQSKLHILEVNKCKLAPPLRMIGELSRLPRTEELEILEGVTALQTALLVREQQIHKSTFPFNIVTRLYKCLNYRESKLLLAEARQLVGVI